MQDKTLQVGFLLQELAMMGDRLSATQSPLHQQDQGQTADNNNSNREVAGHLGIGNVEGS